MKATEIITKVKTLSLPAGSYVVFGSCPMALAEIRQSADIDMLVSPEVFNQLRRNGWQVLDKGPDDKPLVKGDFEAHTHESFSLWPPLDELLASATVADSVPFAALSEVRKWKAASGRPKDLVDVKLIDEYLARK